jgi:hypothetical protein
MGSRLTRSWAAIFGALSLVLLAAGAAEASSVNIVPEIDGATMATGLGVVTGGVLMLRAYWRSRR